MILRAGRATLQPLLEASDGTVPPASYSPLCSRLTASHTHTGTHTRKLAGSPQSRFYEIISQAFGPKGLASGTSTAWYSIIKLRELRSHWFGRVAPQLGAAS